MTDLIFGELREDADYGWWGERAIDFGGNACTVELLVHNGGEDEITERQRDAFSHFMMKWPKLQTELVDALIQYYNEEERFSYGPEDEEEAAKWWPEIETKEALLQAVTLENIVIAWDFMMDKGRCVYLLFSRAWGGEDFDDNGIGVCCINEEITKIGYKDMAF